MFDLLDTFYIVLDISFVSSFSFLFLIRYFSFFVIWQKRESHDHCIIIIFSSFTQFDLLPNSEFLHKLFKLTQSFQEFSETIFGKGEKNLKVAKFASFREDKLQNTHTHMIFLISCPFFVAWENVAEQLSAIIV